MKPDDVPHLHRRKLVLVTVEQHTLQLPIYAAQTRVDQGHKHAVVCKYITDSCQEFQLLRFIIFWTVGLYLRKNLNFLTHTRILNIRHSKL